jgi:hypothetical protein
MDPLKSAVRGRGLTVERWNPESDLLLPEHGAGEEERYLALLDHYAARLLLREAIKSEDEKSWLKGRRSVERFCAPDAFDRFLNGFLDLGVLRDDSGRPAPPTAIKSFGVTYEWYVSRVLRRDFECPAAWGVRFGGLEAGGDHDVIAAVGGRFLYLEVKTSPPKHVELPEITSFLKRLKDIGPDLSIFHLDTHLRMKDKMVPLMEEALSNSFNVDASFERLEREIFHLDGAIYIVNSKPDLRRNLKVVFRHYFRSGSSLVKMLTNNIK